MKQATDDVRTFMIAMGQDAPAVPTVPLAGPELEADLIFVANRVRQATITDGSPGVPYLRARLMIEELSELLAAMGRGDLVEVADGVADLCYVAIGTAVAYGLPLPAVWAEVQRSNMSKLVDGKPIKDDGGKVLKPPGWTPPDLASIVAEACIRGRATNTFAEHLEITDALKAYRREMIAARRCWPAVDAELEVLRQARDESHRQFERTRTALYAVADLVFETDLDGADLLADKVTKIMDAWGGAEPPPHPPTGARQHRVLLSGQLYPASVKLDWEEDPPIVAAYIRAGKVEDEAGDIPFDDLIEAGLRSATRGQLEAALARWDAAYKAAVPGAKHAAVAWWPPEETTEAISQLQDEVDGVLHRMGPAPPSMADAIHNVRASIDGLIEGMAGMVAEVSEPPTLADLRALVRRVRDEVREHRTDPVTISVMNALDLLADSRWAP